MAGFPLRRHGALIAFAMATLLAAAMVLVGPLAGAQADAAPRLLAPGKGKVLAQGSRPTFKVRDGSALARKHKVWITISTKRKRDKNGSLVRTDVGTFAQMKRKGRAGWTYKAPAYTFDTWYMQKRGTYFWQVYHIDCRVKNCRVYSPIRGFKVR